MADWVVETMLGQGSFAVVYACRHKETGARVALKVARPSLGTEGNIRFEREAQALRLVDHPNVVRLLGRTEIDGLPALVLPLADGTLAGFLVVNAPIPIERGLLIFRSILDGVAAIHAKGILHRDLKPGNILLGEEPERTVWVADLSLARIASQASPMSMNGPMGTAGFMAPEQVDVALVDAEDVGPRADVFALGCILYELACGSPPFPGQNIREILNKTRAGIFTPPHVARPDLPPAVVKTIRRCMAFDPESRPANCAEIRAILDGGSTPPLRTYATPLLAVALLVALPAPTLFGIWLGREPCTAPARWGMPDLGARADACGERSASFAYADDDASFCGYVMDRLRHAGWVTSPDASTAVRGEDLLRIDCGRGPHGNLVDLREPSAAEGARRPPQ
jgi:serine/threonine-protein kinase